MDESLASAHELCATRGTTREFVCIARRARAQQTAQLVNPATRGTKIAAVGEIVLERYESGGERLGGISVNFARQVNRSGATAILYAAVGTDTEGHWLRAQLASDGLDTRRVRSLPGDSTIQRLRLESGERTFTGFSPGVLEDYELAPHELADLTTFDAVAFPVSPDNENLVTSCLALRSHGPTPKLIADFSIDSQTRPNEVDSWLRGYDTIDLAFIGGKVDFLEPLRRRSLDTKQLVVLTAGAAGAWVIHNGMIHHQPSVAKAIVNTCGCGDALAGAFSAQWLTGASLQEALQAGALAAAEVAASPRTQKSASPGEPAP